jgi:cobalt transporter subunit CbtB
MHKDSLSLPLATSNSSKLLQLAGAAVFGVVVLFAVGFAPIGAAHNAAHDTRHAVAFPCH